MNNIIRNDELYEQSNFAYQQYTAQIEQEKQIETLNEVYRTGKTEETINYIQLMVRTWTIEELWPYVKFIETKFIINVDLCENPNMFTTLFQNLNKEHESLGDKQIFINTYAPTIKKVINEYRSTAQENFKKDALKR